MRTIFFSRNRLFLKYSSETKTEDRGFTLIELMVVVVILSILVSMSTVSYLKRKKHIEYDTATANVRMIIAAEKDYRLFTMNNTYQESDSTAHTNAALALHVVDGYFQNYRIGLSVASPPFVVAVDSGDASLNCTYTFDSQGQRVSSSGNDCLPP